MITDEQVLLADNIYTGRYLLSTDLTAMRKALEAYEQSKWHIVKSILPEPDKPVLIRYDDGSYDITHRKLNGLPDWSGVTLHDIVTHWQPLPEFKE